MLDSRMSQDLDNYITGHYGEDQFDGEERDPAEDGPEVEIIRLLRKITYDEHRIVGRRFFFPRGD